MGSQPSTNQGAGTKVGRRARFPFVARILLAMGLGAVTGLILGRRAAPLGQFGTVIIGLIKALAGPLLLFAVVDAFLRTQVRLRSGLVMIAIALTNAAIAVVIGLTLSNMMRPGDHLSIELPAAGSGDSSGAHAAGGGGPGSEIRKIDLVKELASYIPASVVKPFVDNSVITIIILAVMSGAALRRVKTSQSARGDSSYVVVEQGVATIYQMIEVMLAGVITMVPVAVFGVVAQTIGRNGFAPLVGLAAYVGVAVLGLAIQVFVVYQAWIVLVAGRSLGWFWSGARDAVVYALGSSSSLATLPVTLRCLDRMTITPQSARMAACVGTNLNNDGILLYEAMAVLFVAQVYDIQLTIGQQFLAAVSCTLAGIGIAAIPDAGLISLALVLATVGLPVEILPLLLTVDWLLSRCRAMTNVTSDILVAVLLDHFGMGSREEGDAAGIQDPDEGLRLDREARVAMGKDDPDGI
jgi:Na+/H+-dicarboxylate symporter